MILLNGKTVARKVHEEIKTKTASIKGRAPCLVVIMVGHLAASHIYVRRKMEACKEVGIESILIQFPDTIEERELLTTIERLNNDNSIDGILIQLPLPPHLCSTRITSALHPNKDVDGLHPTNMGKLLLGDDSGFVPCTPLGIRALLEAYQIPLSGQHVVILGRSAIVGKPTGALLLRANASVTFLHSKSAHVLPICRSADILIAAMGKPLMVTQEWVHPGAVVVDVGINRSLDSKTMVGDCAFEALSSICHAISPVPGGVGPMTIAMLLKNTWKSYALRSAL